MDKAHKLIRKWDATDAAVHDSQKLDDVLDLSNTGKGVWADSAYRSVQIEAGTNQTRINTLALSSVAAAHRLSGFCLPRSWDRSTARRGIGTSASLARP